MMTTIELLHFHLQYEQHAGIQHSLIQFFSLFTSFGMDISDALSQLFFVTRNIKHIKA
jgi:hypothetical protein